MEELEILRTQVAELMEWKRKRELQPIPYPLDEASRFTLFEGRTDLVSNGAGSSDLTESINLSGGPETIEVPSSYAGTLIITVEGANYEVPYIA